jgi:hypothetical protein
MTPTSPRSREAVALEAAENSELIRRVDAAFRASDPGGSDGWPNLRRSQLGRCGCRPA